MAGGGEAGGREVTQYRRGAEFERKVAGLLTDDGYLVVRAAGSHGHADLVALKPGQVVLVQCKTSGALPPGEWNPFYEAAERVGAVALLAHRPSPGRVVYWRLTGPKVARKDPPYEAWTADEVAHG